MNRPTRCPLCVRAFHVSLGSATGGRDGEDGLLLILCDWPANSRIGTHKNAGLHALGGRGIAVGSGRLQPGWVTRPTNTLLAHLRTRGTRRGLPLSPSGRRGGEDHNSGQNSVHTVNSFIVRRLATLAVAPPHLLASSHHLLPWGKWRFRRGGRFREHNQLQPLPRLGGSGKCFVMRGLRRNEAAVYFVMWRPERYASQRWPHADAVRNMNRDPYDARHRTAHRCLHHSPASCQGPRGISPSKDGDPCAECEQHHPSTT